MNEKNECRADAHTQSIFFFLFFFMLFFVPSPPPLLLVLFFCFFSSLELQCYCKRVRMFFRLFLVSNKRAFSYLLALPVSL